MGKLAIAKTPPLRGSRTTPQPDLAPYFLIPFFTLRGLSVINNNVSYALEYYSDINYSTLAFIYNGNKIRFEIQTYIPNVLDLIPLLSTPNVLINSVLYNVNVRISTDLLLLKTHIQIPQ